MFDINNAANSTATLLEPGVYFFDRGLTMKATIIGGYEAGQPGVSLVFTEGTQCSVSASQCYYAGNNSPLTALNEGTCIQSVLPRCPGIATPAKDVAGTAIGVPFGGSPPIVAPETLIVTKDPNCVVATIESSSCDPNTKNKVIKSPGGGALAVAGVQYAPTDNVEITGSASGLGRIGQIIAWTVNYSGGSHISEFFPGGYGNGVVRLDIACSGGGTICNP